MRKDEEEGEGGKKEEERERGEYFLSFVLRMTRFHQRVSLSEKLSACWCLWFSPSLFR